MIYSIISSYQLDYGDYVISKEDLFQEGCIGLIEACKSYKENDNTKFSTYAFVVIERRIQRAFFRLLKPYKEEFSFDKYACTDRIDDLKTTYVNDNPIEYAANQERKEELLNRLDYVTQLDKDIIKLRLQNYSYKEISEMLNINSKKVDNRLARMKRMYKKNKEKQNISKEN